LPPVTLSQKRKNRKMGQVCGLPDGEVQMQKDRELVYEPMDVPVPLEEAVQEEPKSEEAVQEEPKSEEAVQEEPTSEEPATGREMKEALDKVARRTGYDEAQGSSQHQTIPKRDGVAKIIERETGRTLPKDGGFDFEEDDEEDVKWNSGREQVEPQDGDSIADDAEEQLAEVVHYAYVDKEVDREQAEQANMTEEEIEKLRWQAEQQVMLDRAKNDVEHERQTAAAEAAFDEA